ncbi:hypothetical protein EON65_38560 [archaeon]|nr:MAG: hypothetical protein EON65_38560 [archaeon]
MDLTIDELTNRGKASYHLLQTDPSHFYRNYKHEVFDQSIKQVHHKFSSFQNVHSLDLGHQLLGDEKVEKLCESILRCSLTSLNLAGNKLTDVGIACLSRTLRSLAKLKSLNLSWNSFGDAGMDKLTHEDYYSASMQDLDLSCNLFTPRSAYFLGRMFLKDRLSELSILRLGGNIGRTGWGDRFLLTLLHSIVTQGALSRLRALHIPDFTLGTEGVECVIGLLLCDGLRMSCLNISKNPISCSMLRRNLIAAASLQRHPVLVQAADCCFNKEQLQVLCAHSRTLYIPRDGVDVPLKHAPALPWVEQLGCAHIGLRGLNRSQHVYREIKQEVLNIFRTEMPLRWRSFRSDFESNLLTNIQSMAGRLSHRAIDLLFPHKHSKVCLAMLNDQVMDMYSLQDVCGVMLAKTVDDLEKEHKTLGQSAELKAIKERISCVEDQVSLLSERYEDCMPVCAMQVDRVVKTSESVFNEYAKMNTQYLQRKWGILPPIDQTNMEGLSMTLEDTWSSTIEFTQISQTLIALRYEMRLLRIALAQVSLSRSGLSYEDILARTVPCYKTLGNAALYTYYAYSVYHKEKGENQDIHVIHA